MHAEPGAQRLAGLPHEPADGLGRRVVGGERGGPGEVGRGLGPEAGLVVDDEAVVVEVGEPVEMGEEVGGR